jgi:hypothetical protein
MLDRVTQQQDAQIQQMQQGMFAMFGMVQQLITHTGLVPQQQVGMVQQLITHSALFSPLP